MCSVFYRPLSRTLRRTMTSLVDAQQSTYLEEMCILVDDEDNVTGAATKRQCHDWKNIVKGGCQHRAFSVFTFNSRHELLLQKRSTFKITFPSVWTNTCCSHPLHVPDEMDLHETLGVRRAARRKLAHELGYDMEKNPLSSLHAITRVQYRASDSAEEWGEHEMDHVLLQQSDESFSINENEVECTKFIDQQQLEDMIADESNEFSPWFLLIVKHHLTEWWSLLRKEGFEDGVKLLQKEHGKKIYRYI